MSLIVYPYIRNELDGKMIDIEERPKMPFNDLFGAESWRHKIWGSETLKELGCNVLISLKETNIYAEGKELEKLETELFLIKREINNLPTYIKGDKKSLEFRIGNALEAIRIAKKHEHGGVYIG